MTSSHTAHPAFAWICTTPMETLKVELQQFRHRNTGALHLHLAAEDPQNAFLVAFRTVPQDSTGVAHILEHTALCGSRRYPVRDPFFMMTRRSLNTFMNAFTSSDWTAYPFASCNRKDFDNLLAVYLDAAFFPTLNELDFLQEGWRLEFAESDNPASELVYKGIVYNEMKGAMSSPTSALWQALSEHLFPTTTYHYNSGGDPATIPQLTYAQLKAFHAEHYHPSNAIFMTYGDIPAIEQQQRFEELALHTFARDQRLIRVGEEQRFRAPQAVTTHYALEEEGEEPRNKTHIIIAWLLGKNTQMEDVLTAHLLSGVLLDNSASPLRHVLETSELGEAPSPLCGFQDSTYEMIFAAGVEGSNPEQAEAVEQQILETLQRIASAGVTSEMVESVLHQIELSQREISGDGFPYGLQLMLHALTPAVHDADPAAALDIDPILARLRQRIQEPDYIPGLIRTLLLNNPHRLRLTMAPDSGLAAARNAAEREQLAQRKQAMSAAECAQLIATTATLKARQEQCDDPECLPKVSREDIPSELRIPEGESHPRSHLPLTFFGRGTNGLVYQQLIIDLPALSPEEADLLPLYCDLLTEVGSGGRDYLTTQAQQAAVTGGIGARLSIRGSMQDVMQQRGFFALSGKALLRNHAALSRLLRETLESARFDETARIRELIAQERLQHEQQVTRRGHLLALAAAAAGLTPTAALDHRWGGLAGIQSLKRLDESIRQEQAPQQLQQRLDHLGEQLQQASKQILLIGEEEQRDELLRVVAESWGDLPSRPSAPFAPTLDPHPIRQAWTTSTQVNFCAKVFTSVPSSHPDAAALTVLAPFLRNNFLHRTIREQGGAYGGGAGFDSDTGAFRFYSYRDPRLQETLTDFDRSIDWLLTNRHSERLLEEAVLGIISNIDKPGSPAGEAKKAFYNSLHGRTPEQRRRYRQRILEVQLDDLRRVAACYLNRDPAGIAVITNPETARQLDLGLEIIAL